MNTMILLTYSIYAATGIGVTIWVTRKLDEHGVTFVRAGDRYDSETGPAMSHLLVTGFALVAFGFVSLALGVGSDARTVQQCIESLSSRLGWVIMLIGLLHFCMLTVFAAMARRTVRGTVESAPAAGSSSPPTTTDRLVRHLRENT